MEFRRPFQFRAREVQSLEQEPESTFRVPAARDGVDSSLVQSVPVPRYLPKAFIGLRALFAREGSTLFAATLKLADGGGSLAESGGLSKKLRPA